MGSLGTTEPDATGRERRGAPPDVLLGHHLISWRSRGAPADPRAAVFRGELGLPTDAPIVMTGHQPVFWHAGVLAKYLAAAALARREGAATAWCVPDQDVVEPGRVRMPVRAPGDDAEAGCWRVAEHDLLRWGGDVSAVPAGARPPGLVINPVPEGFGAVASALRRFEGEETAAEQAWCAHETVLDDRLGVPISPTVYATDVSRTSIFAWLVERMAADPAGCVGAYNAAVRAEPGSGVRTLLALEHRGRYELPLWLIEPGEPRRAVYADDLGSVDPAMLAPRGLVMTGLLRLVGCDLFIHGTGGEAYDRVTERWFADWLGETLPGAGVASATLRLDLGVPEVDRADVARAVWRAHRARHTPMMLGDEAGQREKDRLVAAIRSAEPARRGALFGELHALLAASRAARADRLAAYEREAAEVSAALADAEIARDRTWPWVLHDD
ncbi:MAG TPA: hypothetical protein ENK11_03645, partial [Phycisphaerales bacterium]|nr:hypothetical protein [Phycisphaerales bacterium]